MRSGQGILQGTLQETVQATLWAALLGVGLLPAAARAQDAVALSELSVTTASPIQPGPKAPPDASLPAGILPVAVDTFSPVTVVTRDQIAREQPRTLGDALMDRPGISASTYAPGAASRPIIRGLDNSRVRIQENGVGIQDVSELGEDHGVPINPLVSDRIEVIRGPATLRYGSQAIGGVVSSENNRVPTFIPPRGYAGQVTTGYSSVDNGRLVAGTVDAGSENVAVHADGFRTGADSYDTPAGLQANSANRSQGGAVGISAIGDRGFVGISFSHYDALYQIPGGEAADSRTRLNPNQDRVLARGEYRPLEGPFEVIRFWAGGSVYKHQEIGLGEDGIDGVQATFKNREAEGRVELQHVPVFTALGTLTGALGLQAGRREIGTSGEAGTLLAPTDSRSNAAYLFEQLDIGHGLRFQAAGRIEGDRSTGTATRFPGDYLPVAGEDPLAFGRRRRFAPKSLSFGALQDLPYGFVASLNGSYVERAPTAFELYSRGAHDATATFEIGDPDLRKERARTVEASIRRAEGPLRLDATGYVTRYTGFIYKRETGTRCGDAFASCGSDDDLQQIVYSQRNATFSGAEIGAQLDLIPVGDGWAGLDAQYDFVRAQFDDGTYVPRIPPHRVGGGAFVRADGWYARVFLLHAFAHTEVAPLETTTPGFDDLRAEVSYTRPLDPAVYGASAVTLGVAGRNLLDDRIRNSASFKKDEILLAGRNVRVFLTARF
ncbi:putative TonB-dependent receptor [Methylobacterium cerastii]|uniref:TonB-dependent receptor n=1 Tax=Methylobacterium cerastii TaxID=932741 RepID=A0ABQ4QH84_9HYPH|nr:MULTISPECIES: TonB-dependent receptor [Methylobacterium]TXM66078.1 TonB-dependent receptor [Methylobacterium sp. WL120]TXM93470.1 TonB-dependent receptor [Methylobacterium sp. WL103]TXN82671.1 TonB-dependent receptor [Methylobacterium sp. WL8]GJD44104.1 putative TonB-dependent receptor [Methylobacterium cerastii]